MGKIYKFTGKIKKAKPYSHTFIRKVSKANVSAFLQMENPSIPTKVCDALADSLISSTHLQLLLDENNLNVPASVDNSFEDLNSYYLDYGKKTLH